jgi:hypothetical protein
MPTLLGSIIAKALAFTDYFLGMFATATLTANTGLTGACGNLAVYDAAPNACGMLIAGTLAGLIEVSLAAATSILSGVLAV